MVDAVESLGEVRDYQRTNSIRFIRTFVEHIKKLNQSTTFTRSGKVYKFETTGDVVWCNYPYPAGFKSKQRVNATQRELINSLTLLRHKKKILVIEGLNDPLTPV